MISSRFTRWGLRSALLASLTAVTLIARQQTPPPPPPQQQTEISAVIAGAGMPMPRLGLPDFVLSGADAELKAASTTIADVLWKDLEFEEVFYMIERPRSASIPVTDSPEALPVDKWAELGAEFVIVGTATRAGAALTVDVRVMGVKSAPAQRVKFAKRYNCVVASPRVCAHFIADELHKQLAGLNGVAQSRIAFISDRDGERQGGAFDRAGKEVYLADYDGWDQRRMTATRALNISPSLSPDGQLLAYVSYRSRFPDIYVQPVYQVGGLKRPGNGTDVHHNQYPAFSPDGSRIAFGSNRDGNRELYVVDRDGRNPPVRLTNHPGDDLAPTWSPTGTQIAFVSDRSSGTTPMLYVMSADGVGGADRLSDQRADRPSWSPLGNLIAFTCGSGPGYDVCVVDVQTRQVRKITDGLGTNEQPSFAPNGQHILFVTTRWGKKQLATVNIKGTSIRKVTDSGNNEFPSWAPARR
jgi:TolB protein